jgi:signal recognition particle subunit SRP54
MFDNLTDSLQKTFRNISGRGSLTEKNISEAMEDVRLALLDADVTYSIVQNFVADATKACLGEDVLRSVKPGQQVIKIVNGLLVDLMGQEEAPLVLDRTPSVIMMVGLHGAGKTTTTAKLAYHFKEQNKKVMVAACDVYRPAAIDQLEALGKEIDVPVFSDRSTPDVVQIAENAYKLAKSQGCKVLILDMAGRLQIDTDMVAELIRVKNKLTPQEILLTADAALGQEAVSVAQHFNDALDISGIILTKMDGDARGGAALSMRQVTGKPIKFITEGEKPQDLSPFRPEGMADRILGKGDIVALVEEAEKHINEEDAKKLEEKMKKQTFDLNDFLGQINQMRKMGGFAKILNLLPGGRALKDQLGMAMNDSQINRVEGMIRSMTAYERQHPESLNMSRRERIAKGSGTKVDDISQLLKRFEMARQMVGKIARNETPNIPGVPGMKATKAKVASKDDKKKKRKAAKVAKKRNRKK